MSKARRPYAIYDWSESLTVQSDTPECDINTIVARAVNDASLTHVNQRVAQYGDFSNIPEYREMLDTVNRANDMFMSLPAKLRERFSNDPAKMVEFLQDPENRDEAVKLGLMVPKASEDAEVSKAAPAAAVDPAKASPASKVAEDSKNP